MSMMVLFKLLHVISAIWFISGLLGRGLTLSQAARTTDVQSVAALVQLSGRFERLMVIPGNMVVLLFGFATAWMQGAPMLGFLQRATSNWLLVSLVLIISMIPIIPLVFIPGGKRFEQALGAALARGQITPELRRAFADKGVALAHAYELLVVAVVVILMITKPF